MIDLDKRRTALLIADFYADMMGTLPHAVSRDCISRTRLLRASRQLPIRLRSSMQISNRWRRSRWWASTG
jgi:hypothetical protein